MRFLLWKWRKHPIRRDETGRSLRQQAFALFREGYRPAQIYKKQLVQASLKTLLRYFEDWKKEKPIFKYSTVKKLIKENPEFTERIVNKLSTTLEMPVEEVVMRMEKPWGIKHLLLGKCPNYGLERIQSEVEDRLEGALSLMCMMELFENSPKQLAYLLFEIAILTDDAKLEVIKEGRKLIVKKEAKGKFMTIELDYVNQ